MTISNSSACSVQNVQSCFDNLIVLDDIFRNKMDAETAHKRFPSSPPECGSQEYDRPDCGRSQHAVIFVY